LSWVAAWPCCTYHHACMHEHHEERSGMMMMMIGPPIPDHFLCLPMQGIGEHVQ